MHLPSYVRISLRELLLLVALVAISLAALRAAGDRVLTILMAGAIIVFLGMAVVAALDRGSRQAFAIGFVICAGLYGLIFSMLPKSDPMMPIHSEFDLDACQLPTSKLLRPLFDAMVKKTAPTQVGGSNAMGGMPAMGGGPNIAMMPGGGYPMGGGLGGAGLGLVETPDRYHFMRVGHVLWALLLGAAGGRLGWAVYVRRMKSGDAKTG